MRGAQPQGLVGRAPRLRAHPRPVVAMAGAHNPSAAACTRMVGCPVRGGSSVARATGPRTRPQRAMRRTIATPTVYGAGALGRVVGPKGCCRPRVSAQRAIPDEREDALSRRRQRDGAWSVALGPAPRPCASPRAPTASSARSSTLGNVAGRHVRSPLSVPWPGARMQRLAPTNSSPDSAVPGHSEKCFLSGDSACSTLRRMRVAPHRCRAPGRFGMWATSSIPRSASFFRGFYVRHLLLEAAHPSLLSRSGLVSNVEYAFEIPIL